MKSPNSPPYDCICFSELAYEWDFSAAKEVEKKIKRRLKYYNLANYDQIRIHLIRELKNDLYSEISLGTKSKYFFKSESKYTDLKDFHLEKMSEDYLKKYPSIDAGDMKGIINFAIYLYYLR